MVLLFDGDRAGLKAVRAAAPLLGKSGVAARVVTLPDGTDPDSFLRERGPDALRRLVDAAPGIIEHLVDEAARESAGNPAEKATAIAELAPLLAAIESPVEPC